MLVRLFNLSRLHSVFKTSSAACLALLYINTSALVRCGAYPDSDCLLLVNFCLYNLFWNISLKKTVNQPLKDHVSHFHAHLWD